MKKLIYLPVFLLISSCITSQNAVVRKLKTDSESSNIYVKLCSEEDTGKRYDSYLFLYNKGIPLVRLYEYETLSENFSNGNCEKSKYLELISDTSNLINDDRRSDFFQKYLNDYYIRPDTD